MNIPVIDTYGVGNDPALSFLAEALDPVKAGERLRAPGGGNPCLSGSA